MNCKKNSILQLNINGFHRNKHTLDSIILDNNKTNNFYAICLQEIKTNNLNPANRLKYQNYQCYFHEETNSNYIKRGAGILIQNGTMHEKLEIKTNSKNLYIVAVKLFDPKPFVLLSIYIPPKHLILAQELEYICSQIQFPILICGDFNAHAELWDDNWVNAPDQQGNQIIDFIQDNDFIILNDGSATHFSTHNTFSAIDLTLCSSSLALEFNWQITSSKSDHFPIIINPTQNNYIAERKWHYSTAQANWLEFNKDLELQISNFKNFTGKNLDIESFTEFLNFSAEKNIPKIYCDSQKIQKPWWNKELSKIHKMKKAAFRKYKKNPSEENMIKFRHLTALFRKTSKTNKKQCWENFIKNINFEKDIKYTWNNVRKLMGKPKQSILNSLEYNNTIYHDPTEISNIMAEHMQKISSNSNYTQNFLNYKKSYEENFCLNINLNDQSEYNLPFTIQELNYTISSVKGHSVGPDLVHYDMIKNLDSDMRLELLYCFNKLWSEGFFPSLWALAHNIPIAKPGKDPKNPDNLRYISLTSNLCKIFERMVNRRLCTIISNNKVLLDDGQSGFRKFRQTYDNLAALEGEVLSAFCQKNQVAAVFFDLSKAYDVTWKTNILQCLKDQKIDGKMLQFLSNFLEERRFKICFKNVYSDEKIQENGVPQGSVLSVTLFQIGINSIFKETSDPTVKILLYADDVLIVCQNRRYDYLQKKLQETILNFEKWSENTGFYFNPEKTEMIQFTQCGRIFKKKQIKLKIFNKNIKTVTATKFLGLTIDHGMTWFSQIEKTRTETIKNLQLFRIIATSNHNTSRSSMQILFNSLVLSRLEYGDIVYASASKSWLKRLDSVYMSGLRIISGAHKISNNIDIIIDCGMENLEHRREKHLLSYTTKILAIPEHPLHQLIRSTDLNNFITSTGKRKPLFSRAFQIIRKYNISENVMKMSVTATRNLVSQNIIFHDDFKFGKKDNLNPNVIKTYYKKVKSKHRRNGDKLIFTDGSKIDNRTGYGIFNSNFQLSCRLPNEFSIFSAELQAIKEAITEGITRYEGHNLVIFTDSLSAEFAIKDIYSANPIVQQIHQISSSYSSSKIHIYWIPSHMGIFGNEEADKLAKKSLEENPINIPVPHYDIRNSAKLQYFERWQNFWTENGKNTSTNTSRQMLIIHPTTKPWLIINFENRTTSNRISRLRIGASHLTHDHYLNHEKTDRCPSCNDKNSIRHILEICPAYDNVRQQKNITVNSLCGNQEEIDKVILFLKDPNVNIWSKI